MNQFFMYVLVFTTFAFAYLWYVEKRKHFTTKVELDLMKHRNTLGGINGDLEKTKEAFIEARNKFHDSLHPIPEYMLEYIGKSLPSTRGEAIRAGARTNDSFDRGLDSSSTERPTPHTRKQ